MKQKLRVKLILFVLLFSFFDEITIETLLETKTKIEITQGYRDHTLDQRLISFLKKEKDPASIVGLYLLETKNASVRFSLPYEKNTFWDLYQKWKKKEGWSSYIKICRSVWNDLKYFPVPLSGRKDSLTVSYEDSWMHERTYGGERGHEGTDIMASENVPGLYPVISMTDGIITQKGWLEKGGYRIGIMSPSGGYFYYAHLDSYADLMEGQEVKAGQIIGYMGNTGYGKEGTKGKFPVHLHLGIYIQHENKEVSINPYWILKYLEGKRLKYFYS